MPARTVCSADPDPVEMSPTCPRNGRQPHVCAKIDLTIR